MTEFEVLEDKQKLIKTFVKYDDAQSGYDDILRDLGEDGRKAPFESNTLLLQILLEIACRNVEGNAQRRQTLFLKMWNKLTEAKLTDELKFHMDALFSVRNQAVAEFEKELMRMDLKELSSSDSPGIGSSDKHLEMRSDQCSNFLDYLSKTQKLMKGSSIYPEKYRSEFEELSKVGKGGFGTVWKARHKIDGICYAVKKVMFKYKKDSDFLKVIREVKSFATLNHLNVVGYNQAWLEYVISSENNTGNIDFDTFDSSAYEKFSSDEESHNQIIMKTSENSTMPDINPSFYDSFERENTEVCHLRMNHENCSALFSEAPLLRVMLYIQMEYCDFDLRFWMDERAKGNSLPFQLNTSDIFRGILSGVAHIHSKNVIHRDLKPQNIFFSSKNNSMKIGDFGLATLKDELNEKPSPDCVLNCGTMPYAAPELRNNHRYDSKVDMYSLGVILIELLSESKTRMELSVILELIFSGEIPGELRHNWPQYMTLVENLVSSDPDIRFSAECVLSNLPVSNYSKRTLEEAEEIRHLRNQLEEKEKRIKELEALLKIYQSPDTS